MRPAPRAIALALTLLAADPAGAVDQWTNPFPGVRMLRRNTSQPVVLYALVIDSCAAGVSFRATTPAEGPRTTSSFGRLVGAQLAINGDFADHDFGLNVGNRARWPQPDTDHSGNFSVGPNRIEMTPDYVVLPAPAPWVSEQLGGRWTLLDDGVPRRGIDDNGPASGGFVCAPGLRHPRTAIGLSRDRGTVYIVVADGRSSASVGMTCDELIDLFIELGAHDAMGLDGGGSSTLWRSTTGIVNRPSDASGERTVRNHLAIFATGTGPAPHCGRRSTVTEPPMATAVPGAPRPTVVPLTQPSRMTLVTPTRLFDTRAPETSARLVRGDGSSAGPLAVSSGGLFRDWSAVGVSGELRGVWMNVAAVGAPAPGFATVYPDGQSRPGSSNLNYVSDEAVANAVPAGLGAGGGVRFDVSGAVHLIADLAGVFTPEGAGLTPVRPTRVLDSRDPASPLRGGSTRAVSVRAPAGATGVSATVAVIPRGVPGYLVAGPCGAAVPGTSNVNYGASAVVANAVVSALGPGGLCLTASSDVDVVVDVNGYLSPGGPLSFVALRPQRLLDTRAEGYPYIGRVAAGQALSLPVQPLPGMPAGVGAVAANVTVVGASADGFATVFPCGSPQPGTSSLNFPADRAVGALAMTAVENGSLCVAANTRAHVIVDLLGVWVPRPAVAPDAGVVVRDAGVVVRDAGVVVMDVPAARDVVVPPDVGMARDAGSDIGSDVGRDVPVMADDVVVSDAGVSEDAEVTEDAAGRTEEPLAGSCGCRAGARVDGAGLGCIAVLAALARRRRARLRR